MTTYFSAALRRASERARFRALSGPQLKTMDRRDAIFRPNATKKAPRLTRPFQVVHSFGERLKAQRLALGFPVKRDAGVFK